ncbi:lasso peptide biosynthesis protein [Candidatus Nephthysia bennettiae]
MPLADGMIASRRLSRARRLPVHGPALVELVWTYASVRVWLGRRSLAELPPEPRGMPSGARSPGGAAELALLSGLSDAVLMRRPFRASCLVRALVVQAMLGRRGFPAQVVITVARAGASVRAHAVTRVRTAGPEPVVVLERAS